MKRAGIIILSLFFLLSCEVDSESDKVKLLQGAWSEGIDDNAAFLIEDKYLIYFEDTTRCDIVIKGKNLEIYEQKHLITSYEIVKLDNHNLWLKALEGNLIKLIKREE